MANIKRRSGLKILHAFRSKVLGMAEYGGSLLVATERGVYRFATLHSKPRKINPNLLKRVEP